MSSAYDYLYKLPSSAIVIRSFNHECPVCLCDESDDDREFVNLPCRHRFHMECIIDCVKVKGDYFLCPICRRGPFDIESFTNSHYKEALKNALISARHVQQMERETVVIVDNHLSESDRMYLTWFCLMFLFIVMVVLFFGKTTINIYKP